MPRKKVEPVGRQFQSWDEVDLALGEIALKTSKIEEATAKYNAEEQARRARLTEQLQPLERDIQEIEQGITAFCMDHRADFGDRKSKDLKHGTVGFRLGLPTVIKAKGFTWDAIVQLLQASGERFARFVRIKPELDKALVLAEVASYNASSGREGLSPNELTEMHLGVEQTETFGYDLNRAVDN